MAKDDFLDKVNKVLSIIDFQCDLADADLLAALKHQAQNLAGQYEKIMTEDRDLKLGIIGRVKAGKSSFLNALLFNGEDRLPKAATPMTAALTCIRYVPNPEEEQAVVHFYSDGDWRVIQQQAQEFAEKLERQIDEVIRQKQKRSGFLSKKSAQGDAADAHKDPRLRAEIRRNLLADLPKDLKLLKGCAELVEMAAKNGISHAHLPHSGDVKYEHRVCLRHEAGSIFADLDDFVGAHGRYTPFVNYLELQLHHPDLEGIQVVDTPGLNDPVASRVDVTHRFLKECDAVMLLSAVSRFLDANLAGRQFAEASVKRAYLIGTMVDIGLMECPKKHISIEDAYGIAHTSYERQAEEFVSNLKMRNGFVPKGIRKEDGDQDGSWPVLVSSLFYAIGRKLRSGIELNKEEQHVLNRLSVLFDDFREKMKTSDDFEDLACFADVRKNIYEPVKKDKEKILAERIRAFRSEQMALMSHQLEDIIISSERRKNQLEKNDRDSLKKETEELLEHLQASRIETRNIFEEMIHSCKSGINDLKINMRQAMSAHRNIKIKSDVKIRSSTSGIIFKDYHYETYTERSASSNEAMKNLEEYGVECMNMINSAFQDLFNAKHLEHKLRNAIVETFKSVKEDTAKADILGPVHSLMSAIAIPEVQFTFVDEVKKEISNQFPSEVKDERIGDLERVQSQQSSAIYDNYALQVDQALQGMIKTLTKSGASFIDDVCWKIKESHQKLAMQLEEKERNIDRYNDFIKKITHLKKEFK